MKIALVGPSRCGKDTAAEWLAAHTTLRYTGSCSTVIAPHAAARLGTSVEAATACRHRHRDLWYQIGNELRHQDSGALARKVLSTGDICCGVRSLGEMRAILNEDMVDLVVWIDRPGPDDPTLEFGPEMADIVVQNHWGIAQYRARLERLAWSLGIWKDFRRTSLLGTALAS